MTFLATIIHQLLAVLTFGLRLCLKFWVLNFLKVLSNTWHAVEGLKNPCCSLKRCTMKYDSENKHQPTKNVVPVSQLR